MVVYLKMFLGNLLETLTNRILVSLASVFLLPPRKGAGLCSPRTDEHPCLYLPPPARFRGLLALPGDRASSIGSESLGRVPTPPLVFWEIGKVTDFPFPYPSGWLPTSQACYFQKKAGSIRE